MKDTPEINWPPPFTFKRHSRAKHVKLKASPRYGLEIVAPPRFSVKHLPEILEANKSWIIKKLLEMSAAVNLSESPSLPDIIHLHSCGQIWKVQYIKSNLKKIKLIERPHFELVLMGNIDNTKMCIARLSDWVREQAQYILKPRLDKLSLLTGLQYKNITIRNQRTRWGSCTSDKNISLNYKLIFLPENLMNHILIHELCHTVHLNHSSRFWRLVASHDPNWKQHCREIRHTESWIPVWVL